MRFGVMIGAMALLFGFGEAKAAERPLFSIGAIADAQYAAEPDAPPRLYHTAPGKLRAAVADFDRQKLAFVVHLGDFIDKDWATPTSSRWRPGSACRPVITGRRAMAGCS
jgi:manganese-dependent ADP-ribose/CDP-alcohol diphosphatase